MTITRIKSNLKKVKIVIDRNPVPTNFEKWAEPGHFSPMLAKGPMTTTWIWNLHANAHDFDTHTSDLQNISRKVFSAHFGQLGIILIWLSGIYVCRCKKCIVICLVVYVVAIIYKIVRLVINLCVKTFTTYVTRKARYEIGIEAA